MACDHIKQDQAKNADLNVPKFQQATFKPNDMVLLNTSNYNLHLPSDKLAPRWVGPLRMNVMAIYWINPVPPLTVGLTPQG
eukprot:103781-Rhodomonas_salina.1